MIPITELPRATLLRCVHCGLCLESCPTYRVLRQEPDSPRGRIYLMRAIEEGRLHAGDDVLPHFDLCLGCRACESACPAGVHYGDLIERTRARLHETGNSRFSEKLGAVVINTIFHPRERIEAFVDWLRWLQRLGVMRLAGWSSFSSRLPAVLRLAAQLLPTVSSRQERALSVGVHRAYPPHDSNPRARVGLVGTCVVQPLYPETNRALIHLLRLAGCEVVVPAEQTCCGSLQIHAGYREQARRQARANLDAFPEDLDYIVSASAGCGATMKEYENLFSDAGTPPRELERVKNFARRVRDGLELLAELDLPAPGRAVAERVAMHDPCHLAHGQGVREAPRALLRRIEGIEVVDLRASDRCCGSAGIYNLKHREMAQELLDEKLETVRESQATLVAVANPGCLLHMEAGARREGLAVRLIHPLEILARAYPENGNHTTPASEARE
jgi:glycolate oxidase iron-sulfur subunit